MKILIVSRWFPPIAVIGAVRPFQIARYLADGGHDVTVLCVDRSAHAMDGHADLDGINVVRVGASPVALFLDPGCRAKGWKKLIRAVLRRLCFPDPYRLEVKEYVAAANRLRRTGWTADIVVSSAMPFSIHLAGRRLAAAFDTPWVADNRDLWAQSPYQSSLVRLFARGYERKVLGDADLCICIGERMAAMLRDTLPEDAQVLTVRNGCDESPAPDRSPRAANGRPLHFLYTGGLYGGLRDPTPLLSALEHWPESPVVEFIGAEEHVVEGYRQQFPNCRILSTGRLPRQACRECQAMADFLFLALGKDAFEKTVLTGKFYEYLEARRPIIALCDPDSELAGIIVEHGLGVATRDPDEILRFIAAYSQGRVPPVVVPEELTRRFQLSKLENALVDLVQAR